MKKAHILVVDDEPDLTWAVQKSLEDAGYEVQTASDGVQGLNLTRQHTPDLVILDVVMPNMDGLQFCHLLRREPALAATPVLILSQRRMVEDRLRGFDVGGDDYLIKPFDLRELLARVKTLLRRAPIRLAVTSEESALLIVEPFSLNKNTYQITYQDQEIQLTSTEFELVRFMMLHPGVTFTSQQLLQEVWGYPAGTASPSLVRWHIKNLRNKIEPNPDQPSFIINVPRHGYMFERRRHPQRLSSNQGQVNPQSGEENPGRG